MKSFGWALRLLSYPALLGLANFLGFLAFDLVRIRRRVALANLALAFGKEKSPAELEKIGRRSYQIVARAFLEHLYLPRLSAERILQLIELKNLAPLKELMEQGKGAVVVSAHFGSWQLLGVATAQLGFPMNFLVQEQGNTRVNQLVYSYIEDKGAGILQRRSEVRKVLELLKKNQFVAMLCDQDAGKRGVRVKFFNQPASVHPGAAYFAIKAKVPIVTVFVVPGPSSRLAACFQDPYYPAPSGSEEEDIQVIMQEITSRIESFVRKYPENWFWPHRRWKSTLGSYDV